MIVVILLGPPAVGKGTQAGKISAFLKIPVISTGQLIRDFLEIIFPDNEEHREEILFQKKLENIIKSGDLVSNHEIEQILSKRIANKDCAKGFILDGFPRTYDQASFLDSIILLKESANFFVVEISINPEIAVQRITTRKFCKLCGASYNKFLPSKIPDKCDHCIDPSNPSDYAMLFKRDDDKESVIRRRFGIYEQEIGRLSNYYQELSKKYPEKYRYTSIDGEGDSDIIYSRIQGAILAFEDTKPDAN